jgi:hypothetical protein
MDPVIFALVLFAAGPQPNPVKALLLGCLVVAVFTIFFSYLNRGSKSLTSALWPVVMLLIFLSFVALVVLPMGAKELNNLLQWDGAKF